MQEPAQTPGDARHADLYLALAEHLRAAGVTIAAAAVHDDATWTARTHTLTLRAGADIATRVEILRDFVGMTTLGHASQLGAHPTRARHLAAVK